jgi:hypothetical protein
VYRIQPRVLSFLLVAFASVCSSAEDPVFSGPQVGETLPPFTVVSVYENAGKEVDPVKAADGKPLLLVFVHKLTRPGIKLTRVLTGYGKSQADCGAVSAIVWLQDDKAAAESYLTRAKGSLNFVVPVGVSVDGGEGPGSYGLNRNVELTILIAKENKVTANFALVQPSVTEAAKIAAEFAKLLDKPAPKQQQLERLATSQVMKMKGEMKRRSGATDEAPARPSNELRELMRALIAPGIEESNMTDAIKAIDKWVGSDKKRQASLAKMSTAVLDRGMGSEVAQKQIRQWQEKYTPKTPAANKEKP